MASCNSLAAIFSEQNVPSVAIPSLAAYRYFFSTLLSLWNRKLVGEGHGVFGKGAFPGKPGDVANNILLVCHRHRSILRSTTHSDTCSDTELPDHALNLTPRVLNIALAAPGVGTAVPHLSSEDSVASNPSSFAVQRPS